MTFRHPLSLCVLFVSGVSMTTTVQKEIHLFINNEEITMKTKDGAPYHMIRDIEVPMTPTQWKWKVAHDLFICCGCLSVTTTLIVIAAVMS